MHKHCGTVHYIVHVNANFKSNKTKKKTKNKGTEEYVKPYEAACFCFVDLFRGQH